MRDTFRDSTVGHAIRFITGHKTLRHLEDSPDFDVHRYLSQLETTALRNVGDHEKQSEEEEIESMHPANGGPINPLETLNSTIIVGWYGDDDPENPQNWSDFKKYFVGLLICLYTFSVYVGSAIYVPSERGVMEEFGVGETAASLGLALYVLAYGIGPMLFSPLSEIPVIGRTAPYIVTCTIFVVLLIPTALVDNFAGLLVLRFLLGFFGSPCLATAGASFQDMFPSRKMPYLMAVWAGIATCGPSFGPLLSSYSTPVEGWRWSQWEILWLSGPVTILMFIALPETSTTTILLHRARRLRHATGNMNLKSQSEVNQVSISVKNMILEALMKPWEINLQDPAVLFSTFYAGLVYALVYTFFESFPLVYQNMYGFSGGSQGLAFLAVFVALLIVVPLYMLHFRYRVESKLKISGMGAPEDLLKIGLFPCFITPIGLFIFAFTSRSDVHWAISLVGVALTNMGIYVTMQCLFIYVPLCYPKYAASLLAANGLARSLFAAAAILFAPPMFEKLGIDGGVSLLSGLTIVCCGCLWFLWLFGGKLRARSKFAIK